VRVNTAQTLHRH